MDYVLTHWQEIFVALLAVIGAASVAVKAVAPFTSSDKDDRAAVWLGRVYQWLSHLALNSDKK